MKNKIIIVIVFIILYTGLYLYTDWIYNEGYKSGVSTQLYNFKAENHGIPCKFL